MPDTPSAKTLVVAVMDEDGTVRPGTFTATLSAQAVGRIWSSYRKDLSLPVIPVLIWVETMEMITLRDLTRDVP